MFKLFSTGRTAQDQQVTASRGRRLLAAAMAIGVAAGIATLGGGAQSTHAQTPPANPTFNIHENCSGQGQSCDQTFKTTVRTNDTLRFQFTASPQHCSDIYVYIVVDGSLSYISPFLDPGQNTGMIDRSPVSLGAHTIEVGAIGTEGGCNTGYLGSWAGTLQVETGQPSGGTTATHTISQDCSGMSQLCDPFTRFDVTTNGLLKVEYTAAASHCSDIQVQILVDFGPASVTTPFLSANQSSGVLDLGAVTPGHHNLYLKATGRTGGCNSGYLGSWGGTLKVTSN